MTSVRAFDYVIVGAGTSGCTAAWNLAARFPAAKIALLEEGSSTALSPSSDSLTAPDAPLSRVPMLALWREALARRGLYARDRSRLYHTTVDFSRCGHAKIRERQMPLLRGRGVGGTHLFHDAQYLRGWPSDYRDWDTRGDGWKWADVLPVFQRMERFEYPGSTSPSMSIEEKRAARATSSSPVASAMEKKRRSFNESMLQPFIDAEHEELPGVKGPMPLTEGNRSLARSELNQTFGESCRMSGLPLFAPTGTVHMGSSGFGLNTSTISKNGVQFFASDLLQQEESNVTILTNTRAVKFLSVAEDSKANMKRLTKVLCSDGTIFEAAKEVVLCAGPIESPALLQRSGVGESKLLHRAHQPLLIDLPAVGSTMCDRPEAVLSYSFADGLAETRSPSTPNRRHLYGEWCDYRKSIGSNAANNVFSNMFELTAFTENPHSPPERPAVMMNFFEFPFDPRFRVPRLYDGYAVRLHMMHPTSRGCIDGVTKTKHNNNDLQKRRRTGRSDPIVSLGFLHESADREVMCDSIEWAQYITSPDVTVGGRSVYAETHNFQPASPFFKLGVEPEQPNTHIFTHTQRRLYLAEAGYSSGMNLYGTCPMGTVVDEKCRVLGVDGLRICGSAIIPVTVSGTIPAISMMTAVRCTDFL